MAIGFGDGGRDVHGAAGKVGAGMWVQGANGRAFEDGVKLGAEGADDGFVGGVVRGARWEVRGEGFDAVNRPEAIKATVFEDAVSGVAMEGEPEGVGEGEDAIEGRDGGIPAVG